MARPGLNRRELIVGATALAASPVAAQGLAKVRYLTPFGYIIGFAETMYADTGGFFEKQGLEVEIQGGRGSAMSVQQVVAGNVLLSRTGGTDHIKAYAKEPSLVAIAEIFQRDIFYVISHADKPLKTAADFAGKTLGIVSEGGATENLLDMMLAAAGMPASSTPRQSVGNAPGAFEFVKQGRIAGFIATSDTVFQLQTDKQPVVAWSTDEAAPCPGQVYMTSRATFEKNADLLARFLRGVETCIGDMIAKSDNLEPVISSMTAKYEIPEAKRPDHGIPVLQNGLRHTFVAPYRDKLASSPARWNTAYDLMLKAGIVPPLEKRDFYDDGARKLAFG